jgi:hypothetical protein
MSASRLLCLDSNQRTRGAASRSSERAGRSISRFIRIAAAAPELAAAR